MANAGAQHQLVGVLVNRYPGLTDWLAEVAAVKLPVHDLKVPAPNSHPVQGGGTIETDATVRLIDGRKVAHFAQVEMQREYLWDKLVTLRAYHASEVRHSKSGGHMFVLSPKESVTRRFRAEEAICREELAFRVSYLSGQDLTASAEEDRSFEQRALALTLTDFDNGIPTDAAAMMAEMQDCDDLIADLFFLAIIQGGASRTEVEDLMFSSLDRQRFESLPSVRAWREQLSAEGEARGEARGEAIGRASALQETLVNYFTTKGDRLSQAAIALIRGNSDALVLQTWIERAFRGETAAQIFPTTQVVPGRPA
jgi:hypothetical protein